MHSGTIYLQQVKQTDPYISMVQYINAFHIKIPGTVLLVANVSQQERKGSPTVAIFLFKVAEKLLHIMCWQYYP